MFAYSTFFISMATLYCLPVKMILLSTCNGSLHSEDGWKMCKTIGWVRNVIYSHSKYQVYFYHVWDAQRAVVELNGTTFEKVEIHVCLPEPTRVLWVEMINVDKLYVKRRFGKYGDIEAVEMYVEGAVVQFVRVESAISALVKEQRDYYCDKNCVFRLLHVDFVLDPRYNEFFDERIEENYSDGEMSPLVSNKDNKVSVSLREKHSFESTGISQQQHITSEKLFETSVGRDLKRQLSEEKPTPQKTLVPIVSNTNFIRSRSFDESIEEYTEISDSGTEFDEEISAQRDFSITSADTTTTDRLTMEFSKPPEKDLFTETSLTHCELNPKLIETSCGVKRQRQDPFVKEPSQEVHSQVQSEFNSKRRRQDSFVSEQPQEVSPVMLDSDSSISKTTEESFSISPKSTPKSTPEFIPKSTPEFTPVSIPESIPVFIPKYTPESIPELIPPLTQVSETTERSSPDSVSTVERQESESTTAPSSGGTQKKNIRVLLKSDFVGELLQTFHFLVDTCPRSKWNSKTSLARKLRKDQNEFRTNLDILYEESESYLSSLKETQFYLKRQGKNGLSIYIGKDYFEGGKE